MFWAVVISLFAAAISSTEAVTVRTKYGLVEGRTVTVDSKVDINSFYAIPFAKPPTGNLRFAKPEEPEPWDGVFQAKQLGPACMQNRVGHIWATHIGWSKYSEDCLHLNIFAPKNMEAGPYPVMVWFHGGGYQESANVQYPGHFLATHDVVVVVVNYRLGIFGFASTGDEVAPGNYGLWDQRLALKFVQENIASFGGDPDKVTIFGQSAGASSSGLHLVSPQSQGLFHRAIYESGNEITLWALNYPEAHPEEYIRQVARNNNCPDAVSSQGIIDCLRAIDALTLYDKSGFACTDGHFCMGFAPVVDGPDGFLPAMPQELRSAGKFAHVDIMGGQTNKDGSPYTLIFIPEAGDGGFDRDSFRSAMKDKLISLFAAQIPDSEDTEEAVLEAMRFYYTPWPHVDDMEGNRQALNDIVTDVGFGYTSDVVYKSQAEVADVYNFVLSYRSDKAAAIIPEWLGVPHNGELPYVWGWPLLRRNPAVRRECGIRVDIIQWNQMDEKYAEYFTTMWTNFAKYGDPTPEPVPAPDGSETTWPKFTNKELNYIDIGKKIDVKVNYNQRNFAFWREYIDYITGGFLPVKASKEPYSHNANSTTSLPSDFIWSKISDAILYSMRFRNQQ